MQWNLTRLGVGVLVLGSVASCAGRVSGPSLPPAVSPAAAAAETVLPLTRIRFYESGIAQFERTGALPTAMTRLPFPAAHLDDVLKTLVLYRGERPVPVFSATFDGVLVEKKARALAHLPLDPNYDLNYPELVKSLKGEKVELVLRRRKVQGRLVGAVPLDPPPNPHGTVALLPDFQLSVLVDGGGIERFRATGVQRIRPLDPRTQARLERAIALTSGRTDQVARELKLLADPGKDLRLAYFTPAPLWRASYRLELGGAPPAASLAGFGLVHNDTDETWHSVTIELANGEPDSFVLPLAAPRYRDRPLRITRDSRAEIVSQLGVNGADQLEQAEPVADEITPAETAEQKTIAKSARRRAAKPSEPASGLPVGTVTGAAGQTTYSYRAATTLTLPGQTSALVPFLSAQVRAERGVWFARRDKVGRAVVRLENTTSSPLPAGTLSIVDGRRFCGEVEMPQLEPNHFGYYDFGTELGIEREEAPGPEPSLTYRAVSWKDDSLAIRVFWHQERPVALVNSGKRSLPAWLPIHAADGARIQGGDRLEPKSAGRPAIVTIQVPPAGRVTRTLVIEQEQVESYRPESLELELLEKLAPQASLSAETRAVLKAAAAIVKKRGLAQTRKEQLELEVTTLDGRLNRLPMAAASPRPEGPVAARFVALEAQQAQLQREILNLERTVVAQNELLRQTLRKLPPG